MYNMLQAKVDRLAEKKLFSKKHLKTAFLSGQKLASLWEDLEANLVTPGQLLGYP